MTRVGCPLSTHMMCCMEQPEQQGLLCLPGCVWQQLQETDLGSTNDVLQALAFG